MRGAGFWRSLSMVRSALESCRDGTHDDDGWPRQPRLCCNALASSATGHGRKAIHVRSDGSFPPKRSPGAGDGCAANHSQPRLLLGGASCSKCGRWGRRPRHLQRAKDRDRGEPRGSAPPTPPYVRVRIRRFEKVTLTRVDQGREAERFEVGIGESHREGFAPGEMPGATAATGHVAQLPRDSQCD